MAAAATEDAFHSLERRFILLQQDHERIKKERDELQRRLTDATAEATQSNAKIASLEQVCVCGGVRRRRSREASSIHSRSMLTTGVWH